MRPFGFLLYVWVHQLRRMDRKAYRNNRRRHNNRRGHYSPQKRTSTRRAKERVYNTWKTVDK